MKHLNLKEKSNTQINLLKDVGYILLLTAFFVGMTLGAFHLKNVDDEELQEYEISIQQEIQVFQVKENSFFFREKFWNGMKILTFFWIVGMSMIGAPFLIGYIGYKGYALGYAISTIIRIVGMKAGNSFSFHYLFFSNTILVFCMMYLANWTIQLSKKFFEKTVNLKTEMLKYSVITSCLITLWVGSCLTEKFFLSTF